ncbi:hypothetical protein VTI74DRAFT_7596 [Chaetomium olivicolor]
MSSTNPGSALSRARSLQKPKTRTETTSSTSDANGNVSPTRLPIKGQASAPATGATRPTRSATTSAAGATRSSRPLSGVFGRITSSSARQKDAPPPEPPSPSNRLTRATSVRQPATSTRPATSGGALPSTRPTTSSEVPRSRPRVTSGASTGQAAADTARAARHVRAKSSVTTLSGTTSLRPPSQTSTTSSSTAATTGPAPDRSRPPLTGFPRRLSVATNASSTAAGSLTPRRHPSVSSPKAPSGPGRVPLPTPRSTTAQSTSKPLPNLPPTAPSKDRDSKPLPAAPLNTAKQITNGNTAKPAFTTHQQSYTPLKKKQHNLLPPTPKPLTSTILAPPTPSKLPTNVALSAETARLQAELLQLSLMHADAAGTWQAWVASAKAKLGRKFEEVRDGEEEVRAAEVEMEEGRSLRELARWGRRLQQQQQQQQQGVNGEGGVGLDLEERVVLLDGVITGLWGLGEPGGRYERVVRRFEEWVGRTEDILNMRQQHHQQQHQQAQEGAVGLEAGLGENGQLVLIPEPDQAWKEECAVLVRRLDDWRRKLRELGDVPPPEAPEEGEEVEPSSLSRILAGCRALVHGMLAELDIMEQIEREAMAEEMRWVREMNRRAMGNGGDEDTPRAGAIWRVL